MGCNFDASTCWSFVLGTRSRCKRRAPVNPRSPKRVTSILANSFAHCSPWWQILGYELPRNSISWSISRCRRSKYFCLGNAACQWNVDVASVGDECRWRRRMDEGAIPMSRFMAASAGLSLADSADVCCESTVDPGSHVLGHFVAIFICFYALELAHPSPSDSLHRAHLRHLAIFLPTCHLATWKHFLVR